MSRIHDALRRAERLKQPDEVPSMDVLDDFEVSNLFPEVSSANQVAPTAAAIDLSGMPAELNPSASIMVSPDFAETEGALPSLELMDGQFRQPNWAAPNAETLFFVQPEQSYQIEREQFRTLRSRLYQIKANQPIKTILISSALPQEGKTFVSANLAMVMGRQHGRRVLLIDADLRKPGLSQVLGAPPSPGLVEYLAGECDVPTIIQKAPITNLCFVPAGRKASNPGELVGNGRLITFIEGVSTMFDWIIVDSPPAVPITDASLIAEACDGVLLVVKAESTGFDVVRRACTEFRRKPVLGVVLNRAAEASTGYQAYYHTHYPEDSLENEKTQ